MSSHIYSIAMIDSLYPLLFVYISSSHSHSHFVKSISSIIIIDENDLSRPIYLTQQALFFVLFSSPTINEIDK